MLKQILAYTLCSLGIVSAVEVLTDANFSEKVSKSSDPWIINFHIPGCGERCDQVQSELPKLEALFGKNSLLSNVRIGTFATDTNEIPDRDYSVMANIPMVSLIFGTPNHKQFYYLYSQENEGSFDHQVVADKIKFGLEMLQNNSLEPVKPAPVYDTSIDGNNKLVQKFGRNDYEDMLTKEGIYLIVFYRPGCHFCQAAGPTVNWLAEQVQENVKVVKVNTDEHEGQQLQLRSGPGGLPNYVFFGNTVEEKKSPYSWVNGGEAHLVATKLRNYLNEQHGRAQAGKPMEHPYPHHSRFDTNGSGILQLGDKDDGFQKHIIDSDDTWVVAFNWDLYPNGFSFYGNNGFGKFRTMSEELSHLAKFAIVDQYQKDLQDKFDIQSTNFWSAQYSQIFIFNSARGEDKKRVIYPAIGDFADAFGGIEDYLTDMKDRAAKGDKTLKPTQVDKMELGECLCCKDVPIGSFEQQIMQVDDVVVLVFHGKHDIDVSGKFLTEFHQGSAALNGKAICAKFSPTDTQYQEKRFKVETYPAVRILRGGLQNKKGKLAMKYDVVGDGNDMAKISEIVLGLKN